MDLCLLEVVGVVVEGGDVECGVVELGVRSCVRSGLVPVGNLAASLLEGFSPQQVMTPGNNSCCAASQWGTSGLLYLACTRCICVSVVCMGT